jgi:hypothetical protein
MRRAHYVSTVPIPADFSDDPFLGRFHFSRLRGISVIKTLEMKEAMNDVQLNLAPSGIPKGARMSASRFRADKDFTVVERDHVRCTGFVQKTLMQGGHAPIGNKNNRNLLEPLQPGNSASPFSETKSQG